MNHTISREEQLFLAALEIEDAQERSLFLLDSCGDDKALRKKLDRMLALHQRDDNLLDQTSDGLFDQLSSEDPIDVGSTVGPFKLLQQIGTGGMGVVYMAQQTEPVKRKVAIKIIKLGMDSRNVLARFESEWQALALMNHPNITQIHDAGVTENGRPFFVMELITGLPITKYADQRRLSLRQRMELFAKVCNAVQHAHQKGIIHRDIKPTNIMVTEYDGEAVPKVIDFGIAKAINEPLTEKTLFTSYGNLIGTPEYMSPEQAEMNGVDVDTCSDVYSLGVVLYELMTGTTPFEQHKESGLLKICEAICQEEPLLASTRVNNLAETLTDVSTNRDTDRRTLNQFLKGDIDWILAKCLAKRRENRYATAAELSADIGRHLSGEPILAAAPSKVYRLKKLLNRHRFAATIAFVTAASLFAATIVSFAFAVRANRAEQRAQDLLLQSQQAQKETERERDRALAAEAKLRELERASRYEAATSRAVARFLTKSGDKKQFVILDDNQQEKATTRNLEMKQDVFPESVAKMPFQVTVLPDGNIALGNEQQSVQFKFANRVHGVPINPSIRTQIRTLAPENRQAAEKVLELVTVELQDRFGSADLFVAEPKMLLAELALEKKDWESAAKQLRGIRRILNNNFADESAKNKNQMLLDLVISKQKRDVEGVRKFQLEHAKQLSELPAVESNIDQALDHVEQALKTAKSELEKAGQNINIDVDKALKEIEKQIITTSSELDNVDQLMIDEVYESLEKAFQKRVDHANQKRRAKSR